MASLRVRVALIRTSIRRDEGSYGRSAPSRPSVDTQNEAPFSGGYAERSAFLRRNPPGPAPDRSSAVGGHYWPSRNRARSLSRGIVCKRSPSTGPISMQRS